jgi:hypothetical protein
MCLRHSATLLLAAIITLCLYTQLAAIITLCLYTHTHALTHALTHTKTTLLYSIDSTAHVSDGVSDGVSKGVSDGVSERGEFIPGTHIKWPPGLINQSASEQVSERVSEGVSDAHSLNSLRFHHCFERGEAFAASYFLTHSHLRSLKLSTLNYSTVNCAKASWLVMSKKRVSERVSERVSGTVTMTLDVMDLSVVHLSAYERWIRTFTHTHLVDDYTLLFNSSRVAYRAASVVKRAVDESTREDVIPELKRTIAAIPFYGAGFGE